MAENRLAAEDNAYNFIQGQYDAWQFDGHSDRENVAFAHGLAAITLQSFEYLSFAGSENFDGSELPDSLKPLTAYYNPTLCSPSYARNLVVRLNFRGEHKRIPAHIPGMEAMLDGGKSFEEIVAEYAQNPEKLAGMKPEQTITDPAVVVQFSNEYQDPGIEFISTPDGIEPVVFGGRGETQSFSRYLTTYFDKPRVLADTVAGLAVLGARHCLRSSPLAPPAGTLSDFDLRTLGSMY